MASLSKFDPRITEEFLCASEEDQRFDRKRALISANDLAMRRIRASTSHKLVFVFFP